MSEARKPLSKDREWKHKLLLFVSAILLFETITGLSIYLLPFSISNQVMVYVHTVLGILFFLPFAIYQIRHWLNYRATAMTHLKLTGYISMAAVIIATISGLILTWQAIFQIRINWAMDYIHIISTFVVIAFTIHHIFGIHWRNKKAAQQETMQEIVKAGRSFGWNTVFGTVLQFAIVGLLIYSYEPVQFNNQLPDDYSFLYGEDRPFAPSLATTKTGGAFEARSLAGSKGCGTSGCHEEIYKEWSVSAHRWSAMDPAFQAVQKVMAQQNGAESTRYCGGCHDPISLFSGTKNIFNEKLTDTHGYQEGVSCITCHAIEETDIKGNAHYVIHQPDRYMFELEEQTATNQFLRDFIIRAYPRKHIASLQHKLFKSPEFCAACHKQFIDQEINKVGWVQLQNQYDNWRKSRWNEEGDPTKTIECRECHMPLNASTDPASGDDLDYNRSKNDKKHRSHRFLAANQLVPALLDIEGMKEQAELTVQWLQGKIEIPEIVDKWREGPAIPIEIKMPDTVIPGQKVAIQTVITNNKAGHDFPTGPLDIIQAWVELTVHDASGKEIFSSGKRNDRHFIEPGSFIFKAEAVDQYGNLIDRHNLWEMVGVRYRRTLFPGFSDKAEFSFMCPADMAKKSKTPAGAGNVDFKVPAGTSSELKVTAKLLYRKVDQSLVNFLFGEESGLTSPITVISSETKTVKVSKAAN